MRRIVASNSTEIAHGVSMSSRAILSMSSSRKAIPVQLFLLFLEDAVGAPRLMNPLQMSGVGNVGSDSFFFSFFRPSALSVARL